MRPRWISHVMATVELKHSVDGFDREKTVIWDIKHIWCIWTAPLKCVLWVNRVMQPDHFQIER